MLDGSLAASEYQVNRCWDLVPRKPTQCEAFCPAAGGEAWCLWHIGSMLSTYLEPCGKGSIGRPNVSGAILTSLHLTGHHNLTMSPPALTKYNPLLQPEGLSTSLSPRLTNQLCPSPSQLIGYPSLPAHSYSNKPITSSHRIQGLLYLDTIKSAVPGDWLFTVFPSVNPHMALNGIWCPLPGCECMWLVNCHQSLLSSAECHELGHSHNPRIGILP